MAVEQAELIFNSLDPPLWLLTVQAGARRGGLIATFVQQAALAPELPRVIVGIARGHHTWELLEQADAFVLHLLEERQLEWVWRFGLHSGRDRDKLADMNIRTVHGQPCLRTAPAWLACRVETKLDTGDRTLYLAAVVEASRERPFTPLTANRMLQLADPQHRAAMKASRLHDGARDAEAVRAWRAARGIES